MREMPSPLIMGYNRIAFMPHINCDANCSHCLFLKKQRMASVFNKDLAKILLINLPRNIVQICITGGEPFYNIELLFNLANEMYNNRYTFSVVTNGLWTRRIKNVNEIIEKLYKLGLNGLAISYDKYHKPRLSEEELYDLLLLIASKGVRIEVKSCGKEMRYFVKRIKKRFRSKGIPLSVEHFSLDRVGTAAKREADIIKKETNNSCIMLCTPVVKPDGYISACCSTEIVNLENDWLLRGNIIKEKSVREILKKMENDFRLIATAAIGPAGLARILKIKPKEDETSCELCVKILNDPHCRKELEDRLQKDKRLRQEVVGRFFLLSHKLWQREKEQNERWRAYFRRMGVEK